MTSHYCDLYIKSKHEFRRSQSFRQICVGVLIGISIHTIRIYYNTKTATIIVSYSPITVNWF